MSQKEAEFLRRLRATFAIEAEEHLKALIEGLLALEKETSEENRAVLVEAIFRETHSLKGASRAVELSDIEEICQSFESALSKLKKREIGLSTSMFDTFQRVVDLIGEVMRAHEVGAAMPTRQRISGVVSELTAIERQECGDVEEKGRANARAPEPGEVVPERGQGAGTRREENAGIGEAPAIGTAVPSPVAVEPAGPLPKSPLPIASLPDTVRISNARLDSILLQVEELLSVKLRTGQHADDCQGILVQLEEWNKAWGRVSPVLKAAQKRMQTCGNGDEGDRTRIEVERLSEFLEWNGGLVASLKTKIGSLSVSLRQDHRLHGGMVDNLLEDIKQVLMLPFASLLGMVPKLVRDLSRDMGKSVDLVITGGDLEIDRRILEGFKDPLIHMIRNSVDHGIELPEDRRRKQKPERGTVAIAVTALGGKKLEVLVSDDGAGIDTARVRAAARRAGLISPKAAEQMSDQEAYALVFQSGVSTSPIITDISGRGLGLAIVREKVERLGGSLAMETRPDAGVTFRIILPLTLATFRTTLVRVDQGIFALPTVNVERAVRIRETAVQSVENRETIILEDYTVPLVSLAAVLELPQEVRKGDRPTFLQAVVLGSGEKRIAFSVDEVLHEQEVLIKGLGRNLSRVRNVAGATILGSGKVVPVLNTTDLLKSAVRTGTGAMRASIEKLEMAKRRRSVLVAEDSITSRMLLKNILESAGWEVTTAVDGMEAATLLKTGTFDIVVSDVDMPRMSGFELTAKIRGDKKHPDLPVVLVTALESREDRERGIDAGANAYIVKSSFDQSNLLEVVQRLT
jgi:two-component system, chemotaxis family, sensor kinase CheA